jgi:hypothetical protein
VYFCNITCEEVIMEWDYLRERRKEIIKAFRRFLDLTKKPFAIPP